MRVRLSARWARVRFQGCTPDYIRDVCKGHCCESPSSPGGTKIPVTAAETPTLLGLPGVRIEGGLMRGPDRRCPMHGPDGLCTIHADGRKPIGCWLSPFVLHGDRLDVRHRYVFFKCHTDYKDTGLPAYRAFASSLRVYFGDAEAARITAHFDAGGGDLWADMRDDIHAAHTENEATIRASR